MTRTIRKRWDTGEMGDSARTYSPWHQIDEPLPHDTWEDERPDDGVRRIWAQALLDVMRLIVRNPSAPEAEEAIDWLLMPRIGTGSFAFICQVLGYDMARARRSARAFVATARERGQVGGNIGKNRWALDKMLDVPQNRIETENFPDMEDSNSAS